MTGAGKYDDLCTYVREQAKAEGAVVIILNGERGAGFSVQASPQASAVLSDILEYMAREIRADLEKACHATPK